MAAGSIGLYEGRIILCGKRKMRQESPRWFQRYAMVVPENHEP